MLDLLILIPSYQLPEPCLISSFEFTVVSPIPTFSLLSIVIAVASALSSMPWDVKLPETVKFCAIVTCWFSSIDIDGVVPTVDPKPITKLSELSSSPT